MDGELGRWVRNGAEEVSNWSHVSIRRLVLGGEQVS